MRRPPFLPCVMQTQELYHCTPCQFVLAGQRSMKSHLIEFHLPTWQKVSGGVFRYGLVVRNALGF